MALFSPESGSLEHLEFTHIQQSIAVVNTEIDEYRVQSATYRTSNGSFFPDLEITCNDTNVWGYSSMFEYSVNRKCYYSMFPPPGYVMSTYTCNNIPLLPKDYDVLYQVDNPEPEMKVYFDLIGVQRHATITGDSETGSEIKHWSEWFEWSQTYVITITTNWDKHCALIREAVSNGSFAKRVNQKT